MTAVSKSRAVPLLSAGVGRPKKKRPEETVSLGFSVEPDLIRALDAEAERLTTEQPSGRGRVSRTEVIKMVLYRWLDDQKKRK
jgi:hypothetical protein